MNSRRLLTVAAAALVAAVLAGGMAYATIPGPGNVYSACMLKGVGTIRLIDKSLPESNLMSRCKSSLETEVSWNQAGQRGPVGLPGEKGEAGARGADGAPGADGVSVASAPEPPGQSCANGGSRFIAANGNTTYACNGSGGGIPSLDALAGASCNNGSGTIDLSYAANGDVSLRCGAASRVTLAVTVDLNQASGTVTSSPAGISCPGTCTASFAVGTTVTLTATVGAGDTFAGWGADCSSSTRAQPCTLTMGASRNVTATFAPAVTLTLNMSRPEPACSFVQNNFVCQPDAQISSSPAGLTCGGFTPLSSFPGYRALSCTATFVPGTTVTLTNPAGAPNWGGCTSTAGNTCTVVLDENRTVTASLG